MEVMFLILSGVILAAGVLYWFWSHIQLTQKKVQLLENAVFELRGMLAPSEIQPEAQDSQDSQGSQAPKYTDLDDDDWADRTDRGQGQGQNQDIRVAVVETVSQEAPLTQTQVVREEPVKMTPELIQGFSSMYTEEVKAVETKSEQPQTLEGMTIKELRRMATERGITGTSEMKKKELVAALRESVNGPPESVEVVETELTLEAF